MDPVTILVVDQDEVFRRGLLHSLPPESFRLLSAANGREALDRLQLEQPHFLVFDPSMPGMSSLEFLRTIRDHPRIPDVFIFILSQDPDLETKVSCLEAGAHEVLVKPVAAREVAARIRRFALMMQEFRRETTPVPAVEQPPVPAPMTPSKEASHASVDLVGAADSFGPIRPRYGIYKVESLIGSGGMGYVFKAYEEPLDRFVAIKILSRKLSRSTEFVQRFRREARVLASMNHPGIAFIYKFGEEEGEHYFAMQWCPGGSLEDLIRKKGRLDILPALDILLQCSRALQAASEKGIVHRDIKPSNLLFDENQQVKIVDFGLASAEKISGHLTQAHEFLGTPTFMAPEQAQSSSVDHRADIYSLGITFYYALYGKYPFDAPGAIEMLIKHATEALPAYDSLGGLVPRMAYDMIRRMTQKAPDDRYPDYATLIQDLEDLRRELLTQSRLKIPRIDSTSSGSVIRSRNLFELLARIAAQSASGLLTLRWATLQKKFWLRQHELILFESTQPDENIWNELVRKELLRSEQVPPPEEGLEKSLNRFLLAHAFSIEDFQSAYRQLMKHALTQVFFWNDLDAEFQNATIVHDAFASVRLGDLLLETARTLLPDEVIAARVQSSTVFQRSSQFELVLSSLNLRPEESFAAYRIEGTETSLTTLQLLTGISEDRLARFVFALESIGAIHFRPAEEKRPASRKTDVRIQPQAAPIPPDHPVAHAASAPPKTGIDKTEDEHHLKLAEQFYRLAREKFAELDYWQATELCKQALRNHPGDARCHHLMALAYGKHPRFAREAEQCFYKAIEVDPWNADYPVDLARFYVQQGLPSRAIAQCEKALTMNPQHTGALQLLSEIHAQK